MAEPDSTLTPTTAPPPNHLVGWDFPPLPRDPYIRVCQELSYYKEGWNKVPEWHFMKINPSELYVVPDTLSWAELSAKLGNKTFTSQGAEQYGSYGGGGGGATRGRGGFGGSGNRGGGDIGRGSGSGGQVPPGVCRDFFQTGSCRFANNCKFNHPAQQSGPPPQGAGQGQGQRRDSVQSTQSGAPQGGPPPVNRSTAPKQTQYSHQEGSAPPSRGGGAGNRGRGDVTIRNDSGRGGGRGGNAGGAGGRGGNAGGSGGGFKLGARPPSPPPPAARADGKVWEGRGGARGGGDRGRGNRGRGRGGRGGQGQGQNTA